MGCSPCEAKRREKAARDARIRNMSPRENDDFNKVINQFTSTKRDKKTFNPFRGL